MKNKNMLKSFRCAFSGFFSAIRRERNMKIHLVAMTLVIIAGFLLKINYLEWIACSLCFALVIGFEMINTAIETAIDIEVKDYNEKAKFAKDVSAGAVLVCAIFSAVVGLIIFLPKIINLFL